MSIIGLGGIGAVRRKTDQIYFKSYSSAIAYVLEKTNERGYEYDDDEVFRTISLGNRKPQEGVTNRFTISLFKNNKEQKKALHIQVYGMRSGTYELNYYIS